MIHLFDGCVKRISARFYYTISSPFVRMLFVMEKFDSLLILGSSGSGKSTLTASLRVPKYTGQVVVPHRYTTRSKRQGEDSAETTNVSSSQFFDMVDEGRIDKHYSKRYGPLNIDMYGFERASPSDKRLCTYSATGASIDRTSNFNMRDVLYSAYVVVLAIDPAERVRRLEARSPDMFAAARNWRTDKDAEVAIAARHYAHEIINTGGGLALTNLDLPYTPQ
jgi:guanylate kinase